MAVKEFFIIKILDRHHTVSGSHNNKWPTYDAAKKKAAEYMLTESYRQRERNGSAQGMVILKAIAVVRPAPCVDLTDGKDLPVVFVDPNKS